MKWFFHFLFYLTILPLLLVASFIWKDIFPRGSILDLMSVLAILFAAIAAINFFLYELIKKDVHEESKKIAEEERIVAKATAHYITGRILWLYYHRHRSGYHYWQKKFNQLEEKIKNIENKGTGHQKLDAVEETPKRLENDEASKSIKKVKEHYKEYIDEAIETAASSVWEADKLDRFKQEEFICKCKNNLAFFLAVRGNANDVTRAYDLGNYIYRIAVSKQSRAYKSPYIYQATWALVLWRFYKEDEASRKEAYRIVRKLLGNAKIPASERERLKETWTFIGEKPFNQIIDELKGI